MLPYAIANVAPKIAARDQRRNRKLVVGAFLLGLGIRLALLPYLGTNDVRVDLSWGAATNAHGLAHTYTGDYFPLLYQTFQVPAALSARLDVSGHTLLKALMLLFDIGCFALLVALFRHWGVRKELALVYWLQPYFLVLAWLGYVDFELGFFALLVVLIVAMRPTPAGALVAGIPLGIAFMLKPQALTLIATVALIAVVALLSRGGHFGTARWAAMMLFAPALLFAGYSAYFYRAGYSLTHLADTYRNTKNLGGALTANMLNIWYPVAEAFRGPGQQIYQVSRPAVANTVAEVLTAVLFLIAALWFTRYADRLSPAVLLAELSQ